MKISREQFEEWYVKSMLERVNWYSEDNAKNDLAIGTDGSYLRAAVRHKWEAWQASRAAIEIELPDKVMVEDDFDIGHNYAIDYCADAINDAGLTVKGDA